MAQVHEIAVRVVKQGKDEVFARRRAAFITKLKGQRGVLADREFESFFALPQPDERPVFVGMSTYEELATVTRVQMNPLVMMKFLPFFMTMELKAYFFAEQIAGPPLELATLGAGPGQIVHLAVRRVAPAQAAVYEAEHAAFYELLLARPGVGPHYELAAVKGNGGIEGVRIGLTVFEDDEAMASAYEALSEHAQFIKYVETFETLASQFMRSTTNS